MVRDGVVLYFIIIDVFSCYVGCEGINVLLLIASVLWDRDLGVYYFNHCLTWNILETTYYKTSRTRCFFLFLAVAGIV